MGEIYLHAGREGEVSVVAHFLSLVVGQRFRELLRECPDLFRERFPHRDRILSFQRDDDGISRRPFHERTDGALFVLPDDEVALPMSRDDAVDHLCRAFLDGKHIGDLSACLRYFRTSLFSRSPVPPLLPKSFDESLLQRSPWEDVHILIQGFR